MWAELSVFEKLQIVLALLLIFDAWAGLINYLAARLRMSNRADAMLFVLVIFCLFAVLLWDYFHPAKIAQLVNFMHAEDVGVQLAEDKASLARSAMAEPYKDAILIFALASVALCGLLARWQRRSFFLWVPLAFLGNVGAVTWLLANRSRATSISTRKA